MASINDQNTPFFKAVLTPHRSLGPNGFLVLMICFGGICFVSGMMFFVIGAWPVLGFFGLDVALLWLAFHLNYRSAKAFEEISVSKTEIVIRKTGPNKRVQEYRFNPFWVRLHIECVEEEGVVAISLTGKGERVDLGSFLNPDDRTSFAGAISNAIATSKVM